MSTSVSVQEDQLSSMSMDGKDGLTVQGFPFGYFRIRPEGSNHYLHVHRLAARDGDALILYPVDKNEDAFIFFVNPQGAFCCKKGGVAIDVINNTLIVAHNRPISFAPMPNPWSHPLPTFSYSPETRMISVQFHSDPVLSTHGPRPESEWKGKEFILGSRSQVETRVCSFGEIARWGPGSESRHMWSKCVGDTWRDSANSVAVEERAKDSDYKDIKRIKWVIETDV